MGPLVRGGFGTGHGRSKSVVLGEEALVWELQPFLQNQTVIFACQVINIAGGKCPPKRRASDSQNSSASRKSHLWQHQGSETRGRLAARKCAGP